MSDKHTSANSAPDTAHRREDMPYRDCAGCAVFNRDGKVLLGRRADMKNEPDAEAWQLPQGGIDDDEEPIDAALRELYEETSIRSVSILTAAPDWIEYDLPDDLLGKALKGKYRGQRQRWFALLFEGDESEINVAAPGGGKHHSEFSTWRWADLETIDASVAAFKRDAYRQIIAAFRHVPGEIANIDAIAGWGNAEQ